MTEDFPSEEQRKANYEAELIRRYQSGLPLSKADTKKAKALIKEVK